MKILENALCESLSGPVRSLATYDTLGISLISPYFRGCLPDGSEGFTYAVTQGWVEQVGDEYRLTGLGFAVGTS
jgi:hypothetical protein